MGDQTFLARKKHNNSSKKKRGRVTGGTALVLKGVLKLQRPMRATPDDSSVREFHHKQVGD